LKKVERPEIYEVLEERGMRYAIRLRAKDNRLRDINKLLTCQEGRPSHKPVVQELSLRGVELEDYTPGSGESGVPCSGVVPARGS
jgi:hypothetical protein